MLPTAFFPVMLVLFALGLVLVRVIVRSNQKLDDSNPVIMFALAGSIMLVGIGFAGLVVTFLDLTVGLE